MRVLSPNSNCATGADVNYNPTQLFIKLCACRGKCFQYPSKDFSFQQQCGGTDHKESITQLLFFLLLKCSACMHVCVFVSDEFKRRKKAHDGSGRVFVKIENKFSSMDAPISYVLHLHDTVGVLFYSAL